MASTESSSSTTDSGDQNLLFEIDLNQIPEIMSLSEDVVVESFQDTYAFVKSCIGSSQPAPGAPAELPTKVGNKSCVCGRRKAQDSAVICDGCERWFHLSCVGMNLQQAVSLPEWMCRTCARDGVGSKRWPLGFISSIGLKRKAESLGNRGLASSELHYQRNGFDLQRQCSMIAPVNSGSGGLIHNNLIMGRSFENADLGSHGGTLRIINANTQLKVKELARLPKPNRMTGKQAIHMSMQRSEGQCEEEATSNNFFSGFKRARNEGSSQTHETEVRCCPPGKYLSTKLSAELVMDILQVWEFLQRFCEILGISESLSFEELEKELISPWSAGTNFITPEHKTFISHGNDGIANLSPPPNDETTAVVNGEIISTSLTIETRSEKEAFDIRLDSHGCRQSTGVSLAKVHSSLLNVLVGELLDKVIPLVDPNSDTGELRSRWGRKKDIDNLSPVENFRINMLPLNELTWPELARRYILAVLHLDHNLESSEITSREGRYVFRCLQGDGGVLCGSLAGVAKMEADALLLAEATKQICASFQNEDNIGLIADEKDTEAIGAWDTAGANGSSIPEWALLLEPVRKLPTNVGSRIRNCVYRALDKDPPEWARKILEHSICKEVYKGNAAGPTKRAVLSVLADVSGERPRKKAIKGRNEQCVKTISDIITEQCRSVLRSSAAADKSRTFCNLLGTSLDHNDDNDEGILGSPAMISRPLDFRTIDLRLAVGYYGGSHEAFVEDVREVWHAIYTVYADSPELIQLAEALSRNFEALYENEVLTLVKRCNEFANPDSSSEEMKNELSKMINCWTGTPKAPWDEGVCKVCGIDKDDESVLLCDTCDAEYHTYCLVPPLEGIPQGNWYCPSCVAVRGKSQNASRLTKLSTRRRQKGYQGEDSRSSSEALNRLAITMGEKEYWELSVEERVFLLKFLCDEVLNSAIIREHLDHRADMSLKLQKKLRSLSLELRNLKLREKTLPTKSAQNSVIAYGGVQKVREDKITEVLTNSSGTILHQMSLDKEHGNQMTPTSSMLQIEGVSEEDKILSNNCNGSRLEYVNAAGVGNKIKDGTSASDDCPVLESVSTHAFPMRNCSNFEVDRFLSAKEKKNEGSGGVPNSQDCMKITPTFHPQSSDSSMPHDVQHTDTIVESRETDLIANITVTPMNLDSLCCSNDSDTTQRDGNEFEVPNYEANSLRNEISLLVDSVTSLKSQLLNLSLRREFLGRDSSGRLYWFLGRPDMCPLLVVDGSIPAQQNWRENEGNGFGVEGLSPRNSKCIPFHGATSSTSREYAVFGPDGNYPLNRSSHDVTFSTSCVFYDSDADIEAVIGWLAESDPVERELRESMLQFCKVRSQSTQQVGNHALANSRVKLSDDKARMSTKSVFTKAAAILEKNYGPCFELETSGVPWKQGGEAKVVTIDDRLYRCECLEPIWPSRQHCISCHQTFCTNIELEEHSDGRCMSSAPVQDESKECLEPSKAKFMMVEAACGRKNEMEATKILRRGKLDVSSKSINFQKEEMGCTSNFEEISRKFIRKDSKKELLKETGICCSNGFMSFAPYQSPSLHDSTCIFELAEKVDVEASVPFTFELHSSQTKFMADPYHTQINNCYPRRRAARNVKEASEDNVLKADSLVGKRSLSSIPSERNISYSGLVHLSALRPLVGKASHILRMLKINLLDIEAVLPEDAFKPTKFHSSNRRAWRTFIKSADSVLKMVKAIIVFEDMIKTAHLKNGWWYWSSLSAAARTSTLSSLALRIYALDAAIIYERTPSDLNGNHAPDNLGSVINMEVQRNVHIGVCRTRDLENILPKTGEKERAIEVEIGKHSSQIFGTI